MTTEYTGPTKILSFLWWSTNWLTGARTERPGQAFFNEFGLEFEGSYNCEDVYKALSIIEAGLAEKFKEFYDL